MSKAQGIAQSANQGQFKNRLINSDMRIDQRNAGASVAGGTSGTYTLDRWRTVNNSGSSRFNVQQTTVTSLSGFSNYMAVTSTGSYSLGASEACAITQSIEGFNTADLSFGTANANPITLSFWVQSSLTGTFSGSIGNGAADRSYPFTYTISSANTWEQKSVTITGDTSGTWIGATNGIGMRVAFCLGGGSSALGTAGAWGSFFNGATGTTSVVGTSGATFYITGVQLEKGSTATSFDYRPYGTELALCQRYYEKSFDITTAPANTIQATTGGAAVALSTGALRTQPITFQVAKRTNSATVTFYNATQPASPTASQWSWYSASGGWASSSSTSVTDTLVTTNGFSVNMSVSGATSGNAYLYTGNWAVSAEL